MKDNWDKAIAKLQEGIIKNLLMRDIVNDEQMEPLESSWNDKPPQQTQMDMEDGEIEETAKERPAKQQVTESMAQSAPSLFQPRPPDGITGKTTLPKAVTRAIEVMKAHQSTVARSLPMTQEDLTRTVGITAEKKEFVQESKATSSKPESNVRTQSQNLKGLRGEPGTVSNRCHG